MALGFYYISRVFRIHKPPSFLLHVIFPFFIFLLCTTAHCLMYDRALPFMHNNVLWVCILEVEYTGWMVKCTSVHCPLVHDHIILLNDCS